MNYIVEKNGKNLTVIKYANYYMPNSKEKKNLYRTLKKVKYCHLKAKKNDL